MFIYTAGAIITPIVWLNFAYVDCRKSSTLMFEVKVLLSIGLIFEIINVIWMTATIWLWWANDESDGHEMTEFTWIWYIA